MVNASGVSLLISCVLHPFLVRTTAPIVPEIPSDSQKIIDELTYSARSRKNIRTPFGT